MSERPVMLVTGASRGIGAAVSRLAAEDGYTVVVNYAASTSIAEALAAEIGNDSFASCADVGDEQAVLAMFAEIDRRVGRVDVLVNNAGIAGSFGTLDSYTVESLARLWAVNLTGPFLCTQAAAPIIRDSGGGAVVNVTSISGLRASTLRTAYGTSKAGLAHLTQQQAIELASLGIRVNAVAPGPVDTAMARAVHTPEIRAAYHDAIPLNRYGLEQELAEAIFFLCSDRASYITGQTIAVDGGFEATGIGLPTLRANVHTVRSAGEDHPSEPDTSL